MGFSQPIVAVCAVLCTTLALCGCTGGGATIGDPSLGLSCVDDTPLCVKHRQAALKSLVSSPDKSWINQPATPKAYASGVRLFAFKQRKSQLSCAELKTGRTEAQNAPKVLSGAGARGLSPAQVSRGKMLAGEVGRELGREIKRRC